MRIAIEAQRIFRKKKGGMDVVAVETIKSLQRMDQENEYIIYAAQGEDMDYAIKETSNFKIKFIKGASYIDWEQVWLPIQVQKDKPDILHCTSNTAPLFCKVPKMVTIHDIIYLEKKCWPQNSNLYQRLGNYYRSLVVPFLIKKADQIITVSNYEKKNIMTHFGLDGSNIDVVCNGVDGKFQRVENKEILKEVRQKYILPSEFIFFLGNTEPRKNMRNLLKAYSKLLKIKGNVPDLVITNVTSDSLDQLLSELKIQSIKNKILLVGYVDFKDLPALYSMAEFYMYPSYREGFGLPILEAMACGTPVITSSVSSMPEIAGDAALLVDPNSSDSISDAMLTYLNNPELKELKRAKGYIQGKKYSWEKTAKDLLQNYNTFYERRYMVPKLSFQVG